ncbi:hypothetical protein PAMP_022042 [Pampus punctatissimus]
MASVAQHDNRWLGMTGRGRTHGNGFRVSLPGLGQRREAKTLLSFKAVLKLHSEKIERTVQIEASTVEIEERGVKLRLTVVDTPGYGDAINSQDCLKPLDVEFMKAIHSKVNIVPVIAKADTLTLKERDRLKRRILDEIAEHGIRIYQLPDADSDEDEEFKEQTRVLKASIPFAVIGSNQLIEVKGKKIRGRLYPWGVVEDPYARPPGGNSGSAL